MKITFDAKKISSLCINYEDFVPYLGTEIKFPSPESPLGKARIKAGEEYLDYLPTILPLSSYRRFVEDGNRVEYETPYFERRTALVNLVLAELCENKGRFMRKICDILWCILEQTTWVLPAHYRVNSGKSPFTAIPFDHEGVCNLDLLSAATGALVSVVYYLLKDRPEEQFPYVVKKRIIFELYKHVLTPYKQHTDFWWRGYNGLPVNNWCAWITSNVLTTAAIVCQDIEERRYFLSEAFYSINCFLDGYGEDGGCDEGPGYWDAAGACMYDTLELAYDMTGGKTAELFDYPIVKNVCDYIRRTHISGDYRFNCADCHPVSKISYFNARFLERMGKRTNNELLATFGASRISGDAEKDFDMRIVKAMNGSMAYRIFRNNIHSETQGVEYKPALYELLPNLEFCSMRSEREENSGMYLGIKGGHNAESHNHNDVGNYVVYSDGKPVIIDIGVGTYTKFTFNEMRYKMHFNFRSEGHNLPVICGLTQGEGKQFATTSFEFDKAASSIKMGLEKAYEGSEGVIESYTRSAKMTDNGVELNDDISLAKDGEAQFIYYTVTKPEVCGNTVKLCEGINLELSENDGISTEEIVFDDENLIKDWGKSIWRITVNAHPIAGKITMRSKFYKD